MLIRRRDGSEIGEYDSVSAAVKAKANLCWADLGEADLGGANLRGANLGGADLRGANLREANLGGTILDPKAPSPAIPDEEILAAGLGIVDDKVWGWRTATSQHIGSDKYAPGEHRAPWFSVDVSTECHPGIYLAGRAWLEEKYPGEPLVHCWCWRKDLLHVGDKWRARAITVVAE